MAAGGKREGAGRPRSTPTETVTFRVDSETLAKARELFGRELNKKVNDYLKKIVKKKQTA